MGQKQTSHPKIRFIVCLWSIYKFVALGLGSLVTFVCFRIEFNFSAYRESFIMILQHYWTPNLQKPFYSRKCLNLFSEFPKLTKNHQIHKLLDADGFTFHLFLCFYPNIRHPTYLKPQCFCISLPSSVSIAGSSPMIDEQYRHLVHLLKFPLICR